MSETTKKISDQVNVTYRLKSTGSSSTILGNCEICGNYCSDVFTYTKFTSFSFDFKGELFEGTSQGNTIFGHENCLKSKQ